jgi:hypothetical protein
VHSATGTPKRLLTSEASSGCEEPANSLVLRIVLEVEEKRSTKKKKKKKKKKVVRVISAVTFEMDITIEGKFPAIYTFNRYSDYCKV